MIRKSAGSRFFDELEMTEYRGHRNIILSLPKDRLESRHRLFPRNCEALDVLFDFVDKICRARAVHDPMIERQ